MRRIIGIVAIILVVAAVVGGFYVAGSPQKARVERTDERRVSDLQQLSYAVNSHYQTYKALPETLADLPVDQKFLPVDPVTQVPYEYRTTSETQYEVCATFDAEAPAPQPGEMPYIGVDQSYNIRFHGAGYNCFTLAAPSLPQ